MKVLVYGNNKLTIHILSIQKDTDKASLKKPFLCQYRVLQTIKARTISSIECLTANPIMVRNAHP